MSMSLIAIGDAGVAYANGSLSQGLSLARRARSVLIGMSALALVPEGTSSEQALGFGHGGLGRCDMPGVAALLAGRYPHGSVFLELPLWRPDDPGTAIRTVTCGDEVYAFCSLDLPLDRLETTLRTADPSFMYNAIIVGNGSGEDLAECPTESVDSGRRRICAIVVGAYDGEGFVVAERPV